VPDLPAQPALGVTPLEDDVPWRGWTPEEAYQRLKQLCTPNGRPVRWAVAAGWALDLFLGRVTREHEDLEIVVLNDDVPSVLEAFREPDWQWRVPMPGWLHPLRSSAYDETHQTWLWSHAANAFVLDMFRDEHEGGTWICRRDRNLSMPWTQASHAVAGQVPFLVPEIVLLFKAKHARAKDLQDLTQTLPALETTQRDWLRDAIALVHPGHDWLALL
jgi:hypothetical protein